MTEATRASNDYFSRMRQAARDRGRIGPNRPTGTQPVVPVSAKEVRAREIKRQAFVAEYVANSAADRTARPGAKPIVEEAEERAAAIFSKRQETDQ